MTLRYHRSLRNVTCYLLDSKNLLPLKSIFRRELSISAHFQARDAWRRLKLPAKSLIGAFLREFLSKWHWLVARKFSAKKGSRRARPARAAWPLQGAERRNVPAIG